MDEESVLYIYQANEIILFAGKWIEIEITMLSEVCQFKKTEVTCFLSYVEDRSKDKHIHIYTNISIIFIIYILCITYISYIYIICLQ
jgi:hypothetical protein